MKLQEKFKKYFTLPIFCGIFFSTFITVSILIFYFKNFTDPRIIEKITNMEYGTTNSINHIVTNVLFKNFQKTIYSLQLFKEYYLLYAQSYLEGYTELDIAAINDHAKNSVYLQENIQQFLAEIRQTPSDANYDDSTYLNYLLWHYDNKIKDITKVRNKAFAYQVGALANMIPLMRSVFKTNKGNASNELKLIYFASESSDLFSCYPPFYDTYYKDYEFLDIFKSLVNSPSCRDREGNTPDYFYFKCRDWWQQIKDEKNEGNEIVITDAYKFINTASFALTVCLKFEDPLALKYNGPINSFSTICADIDLNYDYELFDHFNKQLSGYFYVVKINSEIPIYYPLSIKLDMYSNIERLEFELGENFYINELKEFHEKTLPELIKEYDDDTISNSNNNNSDSNNNLNLKESIKAYSRGSYMKKGDLNNFSIYPIRLYYDSKNYEKSSHVFSLITVSRPSDISNRIDIFKNNFYPRLVVQTFLYVLIGSILVLISWYNISSIATNLVKPIINLKFLIKGMQINREKIQKQEEKSSHKVENRLKKSSNSGSNNHLRMLKKSSRKNQTVANKGSDSGSDSDNVSNDSHDNNIDEDSNEIRSAEMNELFEVLLQLKNVLSFTTNSSNASDNLCFLNYLHAKYTFSQVNNIRGKTICDSNVGNLSIRLEKYDKAVFHLIESLPEENKIMLRSVKKNSSSIHRITLNEMFANTNINNLLFTNPRNSRLKIRKRNSINSEFSRMNTLGVGPLVDTVTSNSNDNLLQENNEENLNLKKIFTPKQRFSKFLSSEISKKQSKVYFDTNLIFKGLTIFKNATIRANNFLNKNNNNNSERIKISPTFVSRISLESSLMDYKNTENYESNELKIRSKETMSVLINSRYPKLIYAYKKFFKELKKILKNFKKKKAGDSDLEYEDGIKTKFLQMNKESNTNEMLNKDDQKLNGTFEDYFNLDFNVIKDLHSLEKFEYFLTDFLLETIRRKDSRRVAEILLEYIEFLIKYKLKFDHHNVNLASTSEIEKEREGENYTKTTNVNEKNVQTTLQSSDNIEKKIGENTIPNQTEGSVDELINYKLEVLTDIGKYFEIFDHIFNGLNMNNSTAEYYGIFLEKFKANKKENASAMEVPHQILYQKANYLKGKLAKYCGHYDKALEYFHRSREIMIICDASIIKKSIKQIIGIMSFVKLEIEKDLDEDKLFAFTNNIDIRETKADDPMSNMDSKISPEKIPTKSLIDNSDDDEIGFKTVNKSLRSSAIIKTNKANRLAEITKGKINSKKNRIELITNYIELHLKALNNYRYTPREIAILIDISTSMQNNKNNIERSLKKATIFFENYVTSKDRFALFYFSKTINPKIPLTEKNYNNYVYVKNSLEYLSNKDLNYGIDENVKPSTSSNLCKAISSVFDYLHKKTDHNTGISQEIWIVVFTDSYNSENNTKKDQEIFKDLKGLKEITKQEIHIIVVGFNISPFSIINLQQNLNGFSKKSVYVDYDNFSTIIPFLKIPGKIGENYMFTNEKYEGNFEKS